MEGGIVEPPAVKNHIIQFQSVSNRMMWALRVGVGRHSARHWSLWVYGPMLTGAHPEWLSYAANRAS